MPSRQRISRGEKGRGSEGERVELQKAKERGIKTKGNVCLANTSEVHGVLGLPAGGECGGVFAG